MKDERKLCANCEHTHAWGILRHSADNVPLYGARKCDAVDRDDTPDCARVRYCTCDRFVEARTGEDANLPALTQQQTQALWDKTSFLNAQVPAATRIAVAQIMDLCKDSRTVVRKALPEFMGMMISQITDVRGAMIRDESKFANLVSHTDEVVESMKGVVQLNERLMTLGNHVNGMAERMAAVEENIASIAAVLKGLAASKVETPAPKYDKLTDWNDLPAKDLEARRVFMEKTATLRDEPIVVDADHLD